MSHYSLATDFDDILCRIQVGWNVATDLSFLFFCCFFFFFFFFQAHSLPVYFMVSCKVVIVELHHQVVIVNLIKFSLQRQQ